MQGQNPEPIVPASIVDLWNRFGWPDEDTLAAMARPADRTVSGEVTE